MPSDRARISYDPSRDYRSIVVQQGRVTLEADQNEQIMLEEEALRLETIDVVGAAGTPDDGYAVTITTGSSGAPNGLTISPGTMYVGGWRMTLPAAVDINAQPDWVDEVLTPLPTGNSIIALLVTEQTVGAIEDQPLREVALGGPDTAARNRLMQRFVAIATDEDTCALAETALVKSLKKQGLNLDPGTLALTSTAGLKVSFFTPATPVDPCCPTPQGGYFGADNQLVRVTVTSYNPATKSGTLLWGWNDASFLYRAKLGGPSTGVQTLTLSPPPIDAEHTPQPGQVVEVLRTSCILDAATATDPGNFIAAREGIVVPLANTAVFDPDSNLLTLPAALPTEYQSNPNPLFLRIWQGLVNFTNGVPVQLDSTSGIAVTIKITALPTGDLGTRPVWEFAVRPSTPQLVYPQSYLSAFQPPTAPRQWLCDLAIISAGRGNSGLKLIADCRLHFVPLVDQTNGDGCCGITLGPAEVTAAGGLQAIVNAQAKQKASLSLKAGTYQLDAPLALTKAHNGLYLSGCSGSAVLLEAAPNNIAAFSQGLITITSAAGITLRNLNFNLPVVPLKGVSETGAQLNIDTMIGIAASAATKLTVEQCNFRYVTPVPTANEKTPPALAAAGIFLQGTCTALNLFQNNFTCTTAISALDGVSRFVLGIWFTPSATTTLDATGAYIANYVAPLSHVFDNSQLAGNTFQGMTLGSIIYAQLGHIICKDNRVLSSFGGLWFIDSGTGPVYEVLQQVKSDKVFDGSSLAIINHGINTAVILVTLSGLLAKVVDPTTTKTTTQPTSSGVKPGYVEAASPEAREIIVANYQARAAETYKVLVPSATGSGESDTEQKAAPTEPVEPGTRAAADDPVQYLANINAIDSLRNIYSGFTLIPKVTTETILNIRNNDISLVTPPQTTDQQSSPTPVLWGILALYAAEDPKTDQQQVNNTVTIAALFLEGNRVQTPNERSIAAFSFWEADTLVTANLFRQMSPRVGSPAYGAITLTSSATQLIATGNIVHASWLILPPPNAPASTIGAWSFYNTVSPQ